MPLTQWKSRCQRRGEYEEGPSQISYLQGLIKNSIEALWISKHKLSSPWLKIIIV